MPGQAKLDGLGSRTQAVHGRGPRCIQSRPILPGCHSDWLYAMQSVATRTCRSRRPSISVLLGDTTLPACPPPSDAPTGPALLHHATGDPACPPQPRAGPCHWVARCLGEGWTLERPARRPTSAWANVGAARDVRESLRCIIMHRTRGGTQHSNIACMHSNIRMMGLVVHPAAFSSHPSFITRRVRERPAAVLFNK